MVPYNLQRFIDAQGDPYPQIERELMSGRKTNHWMWYIFPQLAGLGHSAMARSYGITSLAEATAYAEHPLLGSRLRHCTQLVTRIEGSTAADIFGPPDDQKFHSSMTLFAQATPENRHFELALKKFFGGKRDQQTLQRLS